MSTEMNCLENIVWGSFVARGKKVRLKVWGEALWSTGAEKSHSAVSSMSECGETAEAAAEQGEDSCRKDLGGFFFFFFLFFLWLLRRKNYGSIYEHCGYTRLRRVNRTWGKKKKKEGTAFDRKTVGCLKQVYFYEKRINLLSLLLLLLHLFYSQRCIASVALLSLNFPHSTFAKWSLSLRVPSHEGDRELAGNLQWWEK